MTDKDLLDRILSSDDPLVPSSGFMTRVMDAIEEADTEAPTLPFPWRRFTFGVITILASAASGLWLVSRLDAPALLAGFARVWPELGYASATFAATLALVYAPRLRGIVRRLLSSNVAR